MEINVENAVNLFFPSTSLEGVYYEAVANSIDADATKIWITINLPDFNNVSSFELQIADNGNGFTDKNFYKFSHLLEVDEKNHKGVGRLVFLHYFNKISVSSSYENRLRTFTFDKHFNKESKVAEGEYEKKTILIFSGYNKAKIREYDYVNPGKIKESLLRHFFILFYKFKMSKRPLEISISMTTDSPKKEHNFVSGSSILNISTISDLTEVDCGDQSVDLFAKFKLLYSIKHTFETNSLITAICADERTISEEIISKNALPYGYEMIFLLHSDYLSGKSNASRTALELDDDSIRKIKQIFRNKVSEIITDVIPEIAEHNQKVDNELNEKYPHLQGYFEKETIGFIEKDNSIEIAQKKFLKDQKEILEASSLDDVQYEKYLEVSSRVLTEYVLYRNLTISKLKQLDYKNDEKEIHNLIVPKNRIFHNDEFMDTIFSNNAWLLDDKYMSYTAILSDKRIKEIYKSIDITDETDKKEKRPDITIIFSSNPEKKEPKKVDVVIVELKKLGLELGKKEYLVSQLRQRARILLSHYPDKIQRIWFYGIVDIDPDFRISLLEDDYIELYSPGSLFYKEQTIIVNDDPANKIPWGLFIQSYQSFVDDAENRNSTFLKILKGSIKKNIKEEKKGDMSSVIEENNSHKKTET
ncbi:MAG: ATP-binding protein [Spirochaetaceae bacterium]|jgi:hypothetical protein|nr:ATP-binding protein [Spirochaetaceae bacterium]